MDSYLPRVINQSESEILNSRGKNLYSEEFAETAVTITEDMNERNCCHSIVFQCHLTHTQQVLPALLS
jgi:hypothetical protein